MHFKADSSCKRVQNQHYSNDNTMSTLLPARPRIEDVAAAAGVSTATVSRVLNGRPVRHALRDKVHAAVANLGYVPNAGARALMLQRSGTIGAIFPTVDNAIFAQAIDALQRRLNEDGLQLLIATSDYDTTHEMRQAVNLVARGADALVLCGVSQRSELLTFLRQRGTPCVHVMSVPGPEDAVCVGLNNAAAMQQAVRYLLDLGHRRIAMLAGITRDNDRAAARVAGVRQALQTTGQPLPDERLLEAAYSLDAARAGLRELMSREPRPTAVLCGNDVLAFGALLEAKLLGVAVPGSLSIIGFDDLPLAHHLEPGITTIQVPVEPMWRLAGDRIVAQLRGETVPRSTEVSASLTVRGSTGPAPAA
jgi:LacI family transcriptional regulator